jgi:hypothetical protein
VSKLTFVLCLTLQFFAAQIGVIKRKADRVNHEIKAVGSKFNGLAAAPQSSA